jgi:DNA-binding NtrC family response regulator
MLVFETIDPSMFEILASAPEPVLLVEDDPVWTKMMERTLRATPGGEKFEIHKSKSADQAKRFLSKRRYSLVISDFRLEGKENGLDLFAYCKQEIPDLPFLLTSGFSSEVAKNLSQWPRDTKVNFLEKPFSLSDGKLTMSRLLKLD